MGQVGLSAVAQQIVNENSLAVSVPETPPQ